jgi:hypothetical protein
MRQLAKPALLLTVLLALLVPATLAAASPKHSSQPRAATLKLLLRQADDFNPASNVNDGIYIASITDKYFKGGVEVGLEALLNAGQVYVNGIKVPAKPAKYYMNGMPAIWKNADGHWTWQAHDKLNIDNIDHNGDYSFKFARRHFILAVSGLRGMTTAIWAKPGQTVACKVTFTAWSACQVEKIVVTRHGTTRVWGVPIDATSYNTDGGPNDKEPRTIPTANFDKKIRVGDTVLYRRDSSGWHMKRCVPVRGLMTATDTFNITVNGVTRSDALIVRYNMQAGSRPGQFISATNDLGLANIPVTLWNTNTGYVVGISRMAYAPAGLYAALAYVDAQMAGKTVVASDDGSDVFAGTYWVTQDVLDAYNAAQSTAESVFQDPLASNAQMDAATQALGAAFGSGGKGMTSMQKGLKSEITTETFITDGSTKITDATYNAYFGGNAATGVQALLDAGKVFVNGLKVPATAGETTLYSMNAVDALWWNAAQNTWGYAVHKYVFNYGPVPPPNLGGVTYLPKTFDEARLEMVQNLSQRRGRTVKLTIDAATGEATRIDLQELETVYIGGIETHGATTTINRSAYTLETGRYPIRFDVNGLFFDTSNVDLATQVGDFAVWWLSPAGWNLKRCTPVVGLLTKDASNYYHINGTDVRYEADCSRFNLATSVRPTQFYTAYTRLGLTGLNVTVWCMPDTGNPIGFTYGSNADSKAALQLAITNATAAKTDVYVSVVGDGSDVPAASGTRWVTTAVMDAYDAAIAAAQAVYDNAGSVAINDAAAIYDLGNAYGQSTGTPSGFVGSIHVKP